MLTSWLCNIFSNKYDRYKIYTYNLRSATPWRLFTIEIKIIIKVYSIIKIKIILKISDIIKYSFIFRNCIIMLPSSLKDLAFDLDVKTNNSIFTFKFNVFNYVSTRSTSQL